MHHFMQKSARFSFLKKEKLLTIQSILFQKVQFFAEKKQPAGSWCITVSKTPIFYFAH
jgi:hypothetical protein